MRPNRQGGRRGGRGGAPRVFRYEGRRPRRGRAGHEKTPRSFLEAWERRFPLDEVTLTVHFGRDAAGAPVAELDIYAASRGKGGSGIAIDGLRVPGAATPADLCGRVVIDPPPEEAGLLAGIARLAPPRPLPVLGGPDVPSGALVDVLEEVYEPVAPAEADAAAAAEEEAAADDSDEAATDEGDADVAFDEDDADEDADPDADEDAPPSERSAFVPGHVFEVTRLRLELGEPRAGAMAVLLHAEADAYGEDGDTDDVDVPLVAVLEARLEII